MKKLSQGHLLRYKCKQEGRRASAFKYHEIEEKLRRSIEKNDHQGRIIIHARFVHNWQTRSEEF